MNAAIYRICVPHFLLRQYTGPVTLNGEYTSTIRARSFAKLCSGLSSAWKMEVCDTPMSRAACARRIPDFFRAALANAANSASDKNSFFDMQEI